MKISHDEVIHVAGLARLEIDKKALDKFATQMGAVLEYMDILNSVDTRGVEPAYHATHLSNAFRSDIKTGHAGRDDVLLNAPEKEDGAFVVPKVL